MCMRRRLKGSIGTLSLWVGTMILGLLAGSFLTPLKAQDGLIKWEPLRCSLETSVIKVDPQHRWVAQLDKGWKGRLKVWRLEENLAVGEEVLDIGGRKGQGLFVQDMEWVGGRLLISIIEGYDTLWEWDKKMEEGTLVSKEVPWRVKWLLFDPQTRKMVDLSVNEDLLDAQLFAHPSGDKVLIVRAEGALGIRRIKVVSLPTVPFVKPEVVQEMGFPYRQVGRFLYPDQWLPNRQGFWAIGTDEHGQTKLFAVGSNGLIRKLTPDDHHLLHPNSQAYTGLSYEGGLRVEAWTPGIVTLKGRYAILMSFPKREREHVCLGHYSHERLEKEIVILDVNKPYPQVLKPLKTCAAKAIVPDGRRLVLQEGWFAPYGEKKRVWVWDIRAGTVTPLAQVGWITQVYGWLGTEWMVVEMRGDPIQVEVEYDIGGKRIEERATYEYGLLYVPKG